MKVIQEQVPGPVQKAMNHAHSVFAPDSDTAESMEALSRQWKYILLDFTGVKDLGELSSRVLFADAGDKDVLDYVVIEIPVTFEDKGDTVFCEYLLGFKVGCIGEGGRKVARQEVKRSVLAEKIFLCKQKSSNVPDQAMSSG